MLKTVRRLAQVKPGLGVPQRTGLLVAGSGPYHRRARRVIERVPLAGMALSGTTSAVHMTTAAAPQVALGWVADHVSAPGASGDAQAARARLMLAGNVAAIAAGILAQRVVNHSGFTGPGVEAARVLSGQLAVSGAGGAIVVASDLALGAAGRAQMRRPAVALGLGGLVAIAQGRALRRIAPHVILPTAPEALGAMSRPPGRRHHLRSTLA